MHNAWAIVRRFEGATLATLRRAKPFVVVSVDDDYVKVLPQEGKGDERSVPRDQIERIVDLMVDLDLQPEELRRRVTEEYPNSQNTSYIAAIAFEVGRRSRRSSIEVSQWGSRPVAFRPASHSKRSKGRLDTRLQAEGAEFLVLGHLLLERIAAYKTYTNMPGYDLVATDPTHNAAARIQVKSRWRTGAPGFPIRNFDCDFVVFARLNRGSKDGRALQKPPEYYVFPVQVIAAAPRSANWGKILIRNIPDVESYRERWDLIRDFLQRFAPASETERGAGRG